MSIGAGRPELVVRRFYDELWNQWRFDLVDTLLAPTLVFRGSLGVELVGRPAFVSYVESIRHAFPDWHNAVDELVVNGTRVAARLTWTGTHMGSIGDEAPTGQVVSYVGAAFFSVEDGWITRAWVVGDTRELWRSIDPRGRS